ncbi:MAG: PaaI family thioesterase [Desulfobacca sp.]|nr:PaaI family thioesterase [Desulfobacca sp.]
MKNKSTTRRRHTVSWEDPKISTRDPSAMSGLDYLQAIQEGTIQPPPAAKLIGYRIAEVEKGRTVFELVPAEYHYNPFATVHGGILSTLLDTTMTSTILSTLAIGFSCSTLEIKVNFIRPVSTETSLVRCEARLIHLGKTVGIAEGKVTDLQNKLYAYGISTCTIIKI